MDLITLLFFAVGLCFDSFAVSLSSGMTCCQSSRVRLWRFAAILGISQAVMPFIGWAAAAQFRTVIEAYDHWIAFGLLLMLGIKMIRESFSKEDEDEVKVDQLSWGRNIVLGIATSIDALVAGIAMALIPLTLLPDSSQLTNIVLAVGIIGFITFLSSITGIYLGRTSRGRIGSYAELVGGIILILIGTKVLIEHTIL